MKAHLALVVAAVTIAATVGVASATENVALRRFSGETRYDTAAAISRATFPDPGPVYDVVLARGDDFADALAASHLATFQPPGASLLLTERDRIPEATRAELERLSPSRVTIMGGTAAISESVERELLAQFDTVNRIGGVDRYDTAARAASAVPEASSTAFIVSGVSFADALAAGPVSFALRMYVFPTTPDRLHPTTREALGERGVDDVIILGGTGAVSAAVEADLRTVCGEPNGCLEVSRIAGTDRTETATLLADYFAERLGQSFDHVNLARGDTFPDALAGGPHGGIERSPILLSVDPDHLGSSTRSWLEANSNTVSAIDVFGDSGAVSDAVVADARAAATT